MKELIFATHNRHKVEELHALYPTDWHIISLEELNFREEIPEPFDTLEENARTKSLTIYEQTGKNCFSEDTGLEVIALNNQPGVHTARYAGPEKNAQKNNSFLLQNMEEVKDRSAQFRTIISLFLNGKEYQFEGICRGRIAQKLQGKGGFGYDPLFIPEGYDTTFAEMSMIEKSEVSHRSRAFHGLMGFLSEQ